MTIIAGLWLFAERVDMPTLSGSIAAMLASVTKPTDVTDNGTEVRSSGPVVFGRTFSHGAKPPALTRSAPSDLAGALFVADARVDNRSDILIRLGRPGDEPVDDQLLLLLAYRQWGNRFVDHVIGDFACAAWDPHRRVVTLFRDPTGQRPLHYHVGNGFIAFASIPQALLSVPGVSGRADLMRMAQFIATLPQAGPRSFLKDIVRVEPGQIVRLDQAGVRAERYWTLPTRELRCRDPRDYAEGLRDVLDLATMARMRDGGDTIATHLSAGLDSGIVTATAARCVETTGQRVLAVTSAPRIGFAGPVPFGRIADESAIAAVLAAQYSCIDHLVLRSDGTSPLELLDDDSDRVGQPIGYPCNNLWWNRANAEASARGARVMLTGEMGNLTISAGGLGVLPDYLRSGRFLAWYHEVRELRKNGPRLRGLMAASFGPWVPPGLLRSLRMFAAGGSATPLDTLLSGRFRDAMATEAVRIAGRQARLGDREMRWEMVRAFDSGTFRKAAWLRWGIEERDPTADRRVIEYCFSLPPDQLLGGGETRRLARTAFADRVPQAILYGPRGYQYADWYESIDRDALKAVARRIADSPSAAAVLDLAAIDRLTEGWPPRDWASADTIGTYRIGLLRALSVGIFALKTGA